MLCSLNKDANHSKQQKKVLQYNYIFTTVGRRVGFITFFLSD